MTATTDNESTAVKAEPTETRMETIFRLIKEETEAAGAKHGIQISSTYCSMTRWGGDVALHAFGECVVSQPTIDAAAEQLARHFDVPSKVITEKREQAARLLRDAEELENSKLNAGVTRA